MYSGENFLSQQIHQIDTSAIRRVFDLASKIQNPINLSIGQPDFPVPQNIKEALIKAIQENKNAYTQTQGIEPLREAISQKWQADGFEILPQNVVVSTGVASILYFLFQTIFNPQDEIVLIDPYFLIYASLAQFFNLKVHYLPEDFSEEQILPLHNKKNIKSIIFSSPSNPSGVILNKERAKKLIELAKATSAIIISDEIYQHFDYNQKFFSIASLFPQGTITLNGFSKSHAMTGLRVGYMGVPQNLSQISNKVATLQQYSVVCAPAPAQWAAIEALKTPLVKEIEVMKKRRDMVIDKLSPITRLSNLDGAFYAFLDLPIDSSLFIEKAIERDLLVVPGYIFSQKRNTLRISYAVEESKLERGLQILTELIEENK